MAAGAIATSAKHDTGGQAPVVIAPVPARIERPTKHRTLPVVEFALHGMQVKHQEVAHVAIRHLGLEEGLLMLRPATRHDS
jgi:hypothetical protein